MYKSYKNGPYKQLETVLLEVEVHSHRHVNCTMIHRVKINI